MNASTFKDVSVCGMPYRMYLVEGGVLFSDKSRFDGRTARFMFSYRYALWYFEESQSTYEAVPACHLATMHELLCQMIWPDHSTNEGGRVDFLDSRQAKTTE